MADATAWVGWWRARGLYEMRSILWDHWDPLGLKGQAPDDEYDSDAGVLASKLKRGNERSDIVSHLTTSLMEKDDVLAPKWTARCENAADVLIARTCSRRAALRLLLWERRCRSDSMVARLPLVGRSAGSANRPNVTSTARAAAVATPLLHPREWREDATHAAGDRSQQDVGRYPRFVGCLPWWPWPWRSCSWRPP